MAFQYETKNRIPLDEQLKRAAGGRIVFPGYPACAVRRWASVPIAAYLGGDSEKGKERRQELRTLLGISSGQEPYLCYRDAAELVCSRSQGRKQGRDTQRALRILAAPLADAYTEWKEAWDAGQDTA